MSFENRPQFLHKVLHLTKNAKIVCVHGTPNGSYQTDRLFVNGTLICQFTDPGVCESVAIILHADLFNIIRALGESESTPSLKGET